MISLMIIVWQPLMIWCLGFSDFSKFLVSDLMLDGLNFNQRKKFIYEARKSNWDEPYLFIVYVDGVIQRCKPEVEMMLICDARSTMSILICVSPISHFEFRFVDKNFKRQDLTDLLKTNSSKPSIFFLIYAPLNLHSHIHPHSL